MIKIVKSTDADFREKLAATLNRGETQGEKVEAIVKSIIADVKTKGDDALLESISKFDGWSEKSIRQP
jgi:histidinol dehydrogenase